MANLIWPVEAVLLGVWGFILSVAYSTPFHQFISFTQLLISSTTLFFHALVASRAPTRALAVSQAHSCAIAALFLLYVAVLMHPSMYDVAFKSPTIFGPWPFAANIGLAWIMLILLGAVAMCIPDIIDNQRSALMLHPFGYHMLIVNHDYDYGAGGRYETLLGTNGNPGGPTAYDEDGGTYEFFFK